VYGRAIQPDDTDADDRHEAEASPYPDRPGQGPGPVDIRPGRISGRASASASVAPPGNPPVTQPLSPAEERPDDEPFQRRPQAARPYAEPITDVAGRGRAHVPPRPEYYGELTTDISHRGPAPERSSASAPMPAWPPREPADGDEDRERPRMGGVFPGPATSASAAAPGAPDQASGWPPYTDADQDAFDRFNAAADEPDPFRPEQPNRIKPSSGSGHVRMLPILLSVVIGAILLVGIAIGIVWLISRGSDSSFNVNAGDCVKRSGNTAVKASCSDGGAYQVVSIADTKDQCPDKRQPYVVNPTKDGKTKVLCLKPSGG
jgi:collagen type III alpha